MLRKSNDNAAMMGSDPVSSYEGLPARLCGCARKDVAVREALLELKGKKIAGGCLSVRTDRATRSASREYVAGWKIRATCGRLHCLRKECFSLWSIFALTSLVSLRQTSSHHRASSIDKRSGYVLPGILKNSESVLAGLRDWIRRSANEERELIRRGETLVETMISSGYILRSKLRVFAGENWSFVSVMRLGDAFENGHRRPLPLKLNDLVTVRASSWPKLASNITCM